MEITLKISIEQAQRMLDAYAEKCQREVNEIKAQIQAQILEENKRIEEEKKEKEDGK